MASVLLIRMEYFDCACVCSTGIKNKHFKHQETTCNVERPVNNDPEQFTLLVLTIKYCDTYLIRLIILACCCIVNFVLSKYARKTPYFLELCSPPCVSYFHFKEHPHYYPCLVTSVSVVQLHWYT